MSFVKTIKIYEYLLKVVFSNSEVNTTHCVSLQTFTLYRTYLCFSSFVPQI